MPNAAPEFVTVAEGARLLSVNVRTAQRHAGKLSDSDRQESDTLPLRVRLSALAAKLGKPIPSDDLRSPVSDNDALPVGQVSDTGLTEQLRTENARLWEALARAQEGERAALAELSAAREGFAREIAEVRRESSIMLAATAAGRISPAIAPDSTETGDNGVSSLATPPQARTTPPNVPTSDGQGEPMATNRQQTGKEEAPEKYSAQNTAVLESPRRWWEIWRR